MIATTTSPESTRWIHDQPAAPQALIAGEDVDAISIPAAFGALVQAELGIMMLAGPVVDDADGSWTFLTERADTRQPALPADLLRLGVRPVPAGTPIPAAGRRACAPAIWWTVIGAARRVAHRTGQDSRRRAVLVQQRVERP